jgi:hypothetical protein
VKSWALEKGYPHQPTEHDTPATYETRVNNWIKSGGAIKSSTGPKSAAELLKVGI